MSRAFKPDPGVLAELGIDDASIVVTARPPADEAHYYNPESSTLFRAAIDLISLAPGVRIIMLPRNARQASSIRKSWPQLCSNRTIIIPEHAIDGLNLIWHSDLVVSGGGTMNREAAALNVPVYSVFRGTIGAVDRYLAGCGRLVLLESVKDVESKLVVRRRSKPTGAQLDSKGALGAIVDHIVGIVEKPGYHRCEKAL